MAWHGREGRGCGIRRDWVAKGHIDVRVGGRESKKYEKASKSLVSREKKEA